MPLHKSHFWFNQASHLNRKTPAYEFLFNEVAGLQTSNGSFAMLFPLPVDGKHGGPSYFKQRGLYFQSPRIRKVSWKRLWYRVSLRCQPQPHFFAEDFISLFLAFIDNFPKWSDTLWKSCNKCCKMFKVCLTILGCYPFKGENLTFKSSLILCLFIVKLNNILSILTVIRKFLLQIHKKKWWSSKKPWF